MAITSRTTLPELAALVSQALENAGITATLSGGGAVAVYSENEYESNDLDFVTHAGLKEIAAALESLGFRLHEDRRHLEHPRTDLFLEFPPAPVEFGSRTVDPDDIPRLPTPWGPLRIITPTQCVMDRLAAYWHWKDRQSWDQAVLVARHRDVDYRDLLAYAKEEPSARPEDIALLREEAGESERGN